MNYRHAFHAANFADVLKHAVLARILAHLRQKEAGFRVIDTHAGIGLYDLAGDAAGRTGEWQGGLGRVLDAALPAATQEFLAPWLAEVRAANAGPEIALYPGSPLIAAQMLRPQDTLVANELHPDDHATLAAVLGKDAKVMSLDGWTAVKSLLPPPERRGLLLIDPPFEQPGEFDRLARALTDAHRRFATGIQLLWYPLKDPHAVESFIDRVEATGIPRILRLEHWTRRVAPDGPLVAAGMLVVNPPWTLADEAKAALPGLAEALATGPGAGWRVGWVAGE